MRVRAGFESDSIGKSNNCNGKCSNINCSDDNNSSRVNKVLVLRTITMKMKKKNTQCKRETQTINSKRNNSITLRSDTTPQINVQRAIKGRQRLCLRGVRAHNTHIAYFVGA